MFRSRLFCLVPLIAAVPAFGDVLSITNDTYIDNEYTTNPSTGAVGIDHTRTNYGSSAAVKAVSNNSDNSLVHGLFTLPDAVWSKIGVAGTITSPVTVTYNIYNNQLKSTDTNAANVGGYRQLELHPLLQSFVAGTGGAATDTKAGTVNGTANASGGIVQGADWYTSNGTTPWTIAGGTAHPGGIADASFVVTTPLVSSASTSVTWNITALLNNPTTYNEIRANGLLVQVTDENAFTGNEFASLVSYDVGASTAAGNTRNGLGPTVSFTVPEPATLGLVGVLAAATLRRRSRA